MSTASNAMPLLWLCPPVAVQLLLQPANGDTELDNLAKVHNSVEGCIGGGGGARRGGCEKEARCACGSNQLAIAMACHTFLSSSPLHSMWVLKEEKLKVYKPL